MNGRVSYQSPGSIHDIIIFPIVFNLGEMENQMRDAQAEIEKEKTEVELLREKVLIKQEIVTPGATPTPKRTPARIGL